MVALTRTDADAAPVLVPIGTEAKAGNTSFETQDEVSVHPLRSIAMARIAAPAPATNEEKDFAVASIDARGGLTPGEEAAFYRNARVADDPTAPGAAAVNLQTTVDGALWLAVLATKTTDVTKLGKAILNFGFVPDEEVISIDEVDACPGMQPPAASDDVVWQVSTGRLDNGEPVYRTITAEGDTTRGLSQQGVVRLRLPDDYQAVGVYVPDDPQVLGTGGFPPQLEEAEERQAALFWLRATRRSGTRPLGRVLFCGINATELVQLRKALPEFLGVGNGQADQIYQLVNRNVVVGSTVVQVEEDGWTDWYAVDDFVASTEDDRHYVLDPEAGTIRFGNGVRGRAPQIGQRIRATQYRHGGGAEGNVGAKAISKLPDFTQIKAANPLPARGGAPAEPIEDALERVPGELRRRDRAVTASDFQELALATPGANVGRAECLPLFHPPTKNLEAAGVVSVVVWPREDRKHPGAPMPDRTLLREVCAWLDARRLVTTELYVIPPTYRKVAVAVGLQAKPGYGIEAVRRWVELVIRQYLAPLPPYGPDGRGWPLGRRVYGPELEAAALQVEGVEYLEGLEVAGWDAQSGTWQSALHQPIVLSAWEVPELTEITVVQGAPLKPGEALGPVPTPKVPVPIPTIRQE